LVATDRRPRGAAEARRRRLPSLDGTEPSYVPVDPEMRLDCLGGGGQAAGT